MKKFFSLAVLCLMGLVPMMGGVYYQPAGMSPQHEYPSQEFKADTPFLIGNPRGDDYNDWSNGGRTYLSPSGMRPAATDGSIYVFVATGREDGQGTPTYLIKNQLTGEYIATEPSMTVYTKSASRAQAFTVMEADVREAYEEGGKWMYDWAGADYDVRSATLHIDTNGHYPLADCFVDGSEKCYVICLADSEKENADGTKSASFFTTCGAGAVKTWQDTNCCVLFTPEKAKGDAALQYAFFDLLDGNEFDANSYPIGIGPGLFSEEMLNKAVDAWEVFYEYLNFPGASDEECEAAIDNLDRALKELNASVGTLTDGQYYRFWNARGENGYDFTSCMYDDEGTMKWVYSYVAPEVLDVEASKYVWQLQVIDGKNYFQNYYTKRYMSDDKAQSTILRTTEEAKTDWRIEEGGSVIPGSFLIRGNQSNDNEKWSLNTNRTGKTICYWRSNSGDKACFWKVETIDPEQLRALDEQIAKEKLVQDLKDLMGKAQKTYNEGFAYQQYLTDFDQLSFNRLEPKEGPAENLVDGDYNTYYHSTWSEEGDLGQPHWFQVALEEGLQSFTLDAVRRGINSNSNGAVTKWFVAGTNDSGLAADDKYVSEDRDATLEYYKKTWEACQEVSGKYNQSVVYNGSIYDKALASFKVDLAKPCKYVRFMALERMGDPVTHDTISVEPLVVEDIVDPYEKATNGNVYMCLGEVMLHGQEFDPSISLIYGVPEEVRTALQDAIAKAQEEVAAGEVTEESYKALRDAYDEFLRNYPDPQGLKRAVEDAKVLVETAPFGDEPGYFPEGSTDELKRIIEQVEGSIKDVMSANDVNAGKEELANAIAALEGKVILPEDGVYFLRNIETTAEGMEKERYAASFRTGENTLGWGDDIIYECKNSPCYYWKVTKNADGTFGLYNYGTANYLYAQAEKRGENVVAGPQKASVKLRPARIGQEFVAGNFDIMLNDTECLNFESTGRIVSWSADANCAVEFIEPSDDWSGDYSFLYEPMVPQIITLPYDLKNDCISPLLKLVGTYNGAFQFEEYADDEVIPAGTPVLYYSEDKNFETDVFALTTDDLEALTYTTEAKVQNGMVGVLSAVKELPLGSGIFFNNTIIGSEEGEGVDANTGYFLVDATTDHEGTLSIPYDNTVKTLEEGIQNALVINNKTSRGTFNLMGQKVQGKLPSGLYIVNGKKYIVR